MELQQQPTGSADRSANCVDRQESNSVNNSDGESMEVKSGIAER